MTKLPKFKTQDSKWLVTGGLIGAVLASTCCLGPLAFVVLGASGAWIGSLTAMKAYQPYFIVIAVLFLGIGFWNLYRPAATKCNDDGFCASPQVLSAQKIVFWIATVLTLLAISVNWWAPLFY